MTFVNKASFIQLRLALLSFLQMQDWADILIISSAQGKLTVRVSNIDVVTAQADYKNNKFLEYYVGGAPQELREKYVPIIFSLHRCLLWVRWSILSHFMENNLSFCSSSQV